jgi:hypothetical protein
MVFQGLGLQLPVRKGMPVCCKNVLYPIPRLGRSTSQSRYKAGLDSLTLTYYVSN